MTDEKKKSKTVVAMIAASIPALVTGYLNHLKDEASRAALVNESIRLEKKIDACQTKADQNAGFLTAAAFFGLGSGIPVQPEIDAGATSIVIEEPEPEDPRSLLEQTFGISDEPEEPDAPPEPVTTSTRPNGADPPAKHTEPNRARPAARKKRNFKKRYEALF